MSFHIFWYFSLLVRLLLIVWLKHDAVYSQCLGVRTFVHLTVGGAAVDKHLHLRLAYIIRGGGEGVCAYEYGVNAYTILIGKFVNVCCCIWRIWLIVLVVAGEHGVLSDKAWVCRIVNALLDVICVAVKTVALDRKSVV